MKPTTDKEIWNNFLYTLFGFQKTKSRMHLLVIVIIHISVWLLFLQLPLLFYPVRVDDKTFWYREFLSKLLPIGLFYLNYYFFLPRFFEKKKFRSYFLWVLAALLVILLTDTFIREKIFRTFQQVIVSPGKGNVFVRNPTGAAPNTIFFRNDSATGNMPLPPFPFPERKLLGIPMRIIFFSINRTVSLAIFLLLASGMIRLGYSFIKSQNEKKTLENLNLNAEVNFLKSQINPHFLFNTLNSIYSQAHNKSEHTEYSILKLSELLRYVLYESGEEKVSLEKDIQYINNYIDLQRIRLSAKISLNYSVVGKMEGNRIAPLLLMTFIENTFKHGISYSQSSVINISIAVFEKTLTLNISNPVIKNNTFTQGGLGLKNVVRRLELLYPGKHTLDISHNDSLYIVNLKLDLT
ncbi:MAG: histidine kinase [Bacteroidetes bacterium]|nr:histidine kinase [Bacteroidota bacterium]